MASDRLTQLQEAVNVQAENFCNSIGTLQAYAKESSFPELENSDDSNDECTETNSTNATIDPFSTRLSFQDISASLLNACSSSSTIPSSVASTVNTSSSASSSQQTSMDSNSNDERIKQANIDLNDSSSQSTPPEDFSQYFARLVARTAKDIDTLVESLPNIAETESDSYSDSIKQIEEENAESIEKLEKAIEQGETILEKIREALDDIAMTLSQSPN